MHSLKYYLFAFLVLSVFVSCNDKKKHEQKSNVNRILNLDSTIEILNLDSSKASRFLEFYKLEKLYVLDTISLAKIYFNLFLNDTSNSSHKFDQLEKVLQWEHKISNQPSGRIILAQANHYKAGFYESKGTFNEVIQSCEKYALYANHKLDSIYKIENCVQMGNAYERLGDTKKAIAVLEDAMKYAQILNDIHSTAEVTIALSNSYCQNLEMGKAKQIIEQALTLKNLSADDRDFLTMGKCNLMDEVDLKISTLLQLLKLTQNANVKFYCRRILSESYLEKEMISNAIKFYIEAINTPKQEARMIAKTYLDLAIIYEQLNKKDSAIYYSNLGMKIVAVTNRKGEFEMPDFEKLTSENTIYDISIFNASLLLEHEAQSNADTLNIVTAIQYLESAKKVAELIRKEVVFDETKFEWGIDLKMASEKLIHCNYKLYTLTQNDNYAKRAFLICDESKATALLDNVESNILANETTDSNYAHFINLRKQLNDLEVAQHNSKSNSQKDSLREISNGIISKLSTFKALTRVMDIGKSDVFTFDDLTSYLGKKNFSALSYFIGEQFLYWFYVNPASHEIKFTQCDTTILSSINQLCNLQHSEKSFTSNKDSFLNVSSSVFKNLVGNSLENDHSVATLVFPDGNLNNIAFDALLTDSLNLNSFLIKKANIGYAYSIRSLIKQSQRDESKFNQLIFYAPFTQKNSRGHPVLAGSKLELKNIMSSIETSSQLDSFASFPNFKNDIEESKFIHIASHASSDGIPHLEFYDSSILVNSIYHLPMNQSLAYLNTCQSGTGLTIFNEGNLSLSRAFYSNGVHNVIMTLWNMNDVSSTKISDFFYKNLKTSNNSIESLHQSKLEYLSNESLDKQAPYYWASLQHLGDGSMTIQSEYNYWWKILIVTGLLGLGFFFFKRKRLF